MPNQLTDTFETLRGVLVDKFDISADSIKRDARIATGLTFQGKPAPFDEQSVGELVCILEEILRIDIPNDILDKLGSNFTLGALDNILKTVPAIADPQ